MQKSKTGTSGRGNASAIARLPLAVAIYFAISSAAFAQTDTQDPAKDAMAQAGSKAPTKDKTATLDTITVTAQKRKENLQKVPISIQVLDTKKLTELNIKSFDDYAKMLPSVSYSSVAPGFGQVYMRGVSSGGDGNHSGPLPSVGIYLDEEPITTIDGALDIHVYDVARVEALSGPQGTLYGSSSQAGTLRIITNKPDPSKFAAGYSLEANTLSGGGNGYVAEGFLNQPINDHTAIRLVGWKEHDAGWIDNVASSRTFPTSGITVDNGPGCVGSPTSVCTHNAKKNYNDVDIAGARAALKIDINDNWTITPAVMGQYENQNGSFASDSRFGTQSLSHAYADTSNDRWVQAALTVEGKIGNFDVTYAFADLNRHVDVASDYSDYSFWYDTLAGYGAYIFDNSGAVINPSQHIQGRDGYHKVSHELRISSPKEDRLRFIGGVFAQSQSHDIMQDYVIDGFSPGLSNTGWPGSLWLTKQVRKDNDNALFGELSYDLTDKLTATVGGRYFRVDNSLKGYFGFSQGYFPLSAFHDSDHDAPVPPYGEAACVAQFGADPAAWTKFHGAPCTVFNKTVKEHGSIGKVNLNYQITPDAMIYGTWSEGFRPGGINRRGTLPPYLSDFLTNYEFGWKTTWFDHRLSWNGAVFREDWKDFQFAVLGANGLTEIRNAGQARINGFETSLNWAATYNLHLSGGFSYYDAKLTANYCGFTAANGTPVTICPPGTIIPDTSDDDNDGGTVPGPQALAGTRLPVTPKVKGNLTARYTFDAGDYEAYVQGSFVGVGRRTSDLRVSGFDPVGGPQTHAPATIQGDLAGYGTTDFAAGFKKNGWSVDFFLKNAFNKRAPLTRFLQCAEKVCGNPDQVSGLAPDIYTVYSQPRSFGVTFSQEF